MKSASAILSVLLTSFSLAHAAVSTYEGFDYATAGEFSTSTTGGTGWNGAWYNNATTQSTSGDRGAISGGSLSAPPAMVTTGNRVTRGSVNAGSERLLADTSKIDTEQDGTYFFSVLGSINGNSWSFGLYSGTKGTYNPVVSFSLTGSGNATMRLYNPTLDAFEDGAVTRTIATGVTGDFLWVGRLETSAGDDRLDTWIYTDLNAVPANMPALQAAPPPFIVVNGSNVNIYDVEQVIDRIGFNLYTDSALDEIRLGDSWDSVVSGAAVPEPGTYALLISLGTLTLAVVRRRK